MSSGNVKSLLSSANDGRKLKRVLALGILAGWSILLGSTEDAAQSQEEIWLTPEKQAAVDQYNARIEAARNSPKTGVVPITDDEDRGGSPVPNQPAGSGLLYAIPSMQGSMYDHGKYHLEIHGAGLSTRHPPSSLTQGGLMLNQTRASRGFG
jgi:hypothetical protein